MSSPLKLQNTQCLVDQLSATIFGTDIYFKLRRDRKRPKDGRLFIQCYYSANCVVTGKSTILNGRKWYLSDHMTDDEIVKTCYAAFKAAVEHEVMEAFQYNGRRVFNPHTPFRVLLEASATEEYRTPARVACAACDRGDFQLGHHHECPKASL